jgi:hypothetical protein
VVVIKEEIFRFDVAVEDIIVVKVLYCLASLDKELACFFIIEFLLLMDIRIKVAVGRVLEHDVDIVFFLECVIECDNIAIV